MNIFALIEGVFRLIGLWEGLKDYVNAQEVDRMRNDLLKIHEDEEQIKKANDETSIYNAQSNITKSSQ